MGYYFVNVLRPLFVLNPRYVLPVGSLARPVGLLLVATLLVATLLVSLLATRLVNSLDPNELLRDD